jgi:adenylate cyclase
MRAAAWVQFRDVGAARASWQRARDVADRLGAGEPNKVAMQIRPRAVLCASAFRFSGSIEDAGYDELRQLCISAGDDLSLALGMAGMLTIFIFHNRFREATRVASDCSRLIESIGDQTLTLTLCVAAGNAKFQSGEVMEGLRLAQRAIDVADGDLVMDNFIVGSPLAFATSLRGINRMTMAIPGWRDDLHRGAAMAKSIDTTTYVAGILLKYSPVPHGASLADATAIEETAEALELAQRCADDFALDSARLIRGIVLVNAEPSHHLDGLALLNEYRDACLRHGYATKAVRWVDIENARQKARVGDVDGAIDTARVAVDFLYESGDMTTRGPAVAALVESLLLRGHDADVAQAEAENDRLTAMPTDPGFVLHELPLLRLRALLAQANGDEAAYRDHRDRYRAMATDLGFEGHMAIGAAMR